MSKLISKKWECQYFYDLLVKMVTVDGRSELCQFKIHFERIAERFKWSDHQRLERLIESLWDKALRLYSTCAKPVPKNYRDLCKKINSRFGQKELPLTVKRKLQDIKQENKTVEEFAEQVQEIPKLTNSLVYNQTVRNPLRGQQLNLDHPLL